MNCESCAEYLADFLLDELPEAQAVLVHEHLNLCPACMKAYKELKGTGKALEAVPVMRPVRGSEKFIQAVKAEAAVELSKIVAKLPPDKRLRLEARRAARASQVQRPVPAPRSPWSATLLAIVVAGVAALLVILLYPKKVTDVRAALGKLALTVGKVDQFYQRAYEPHSPAKEGKDVVSGDAFSTGETGRARFDMADGSAVFLGPSSDATFRLSGDGAGGISIVLEGGELGVRRGGGASPKSAEAKNPEVWDVRCGQVRYTLSSDAHIYLQGNKNGKEYAGALTVIAGTAQVLKQSGEKIAMVGAGLRLPMPGSDNLVPETERLASLRVPAWRCELATEHELSKLIKGSIRIVNRQNGLEVQLGYGRQQPKLGAQDWAGDGPLDIIGQRAEGEFVLPPRLRFRHMVPFAAPLDIELSLNRDSQRDTSFAFGALDTTEGGVAVDVSGSAVLQVREKERTARSNIPTSTKAGQPEKLLLELGRERAKPAAVLSSSVEKSKPLPLPRNLSDAVAPIWLQVLGEGIIIDEIKISGVIPAEWLGERLGK